MSHPQAAQGANLQAAHPISIVFLLHILVDGPICFSSLVRPEALPFLDMSNTTLLVLKLYAGFLLASFLAALMCWKLPEFLPGKRAFALQLCLYHTIATTALLHTPRFIPITLGATPESLGVTIERIWCAMHGLLSAAFALWWHITLPYAVALKAANHPSKAH